MPETATLTTHVPAPLLEYGLEQREIDDSVSEALALKLFETGRITSGVAARLLGMNRLAFLDLLHKRGIPYFDYTREELEKEMRVFDTLQAARPA
jgi:predicted HTH domain antitoxin